MRALLTAPCARHDSGTWHTIVGGDFGSYVSYEDHTFANFYMMRPPNARESAQGVTERVRPPPNPSALRR